LAVASLSSPSMAGPPGADPESDARRLDREDLHLAAVGGTELGHGEADVDAAPGRWPWPAVGRLGEFLVGGPSCSCRLRRTRSRAAPNAASPARPRSLSTTGPVARLAVLVDGMVVGSGISG
jgi:hypothetical protein